MCYKLLCVFDQWCSHSKTKQDWMNSKTNSATPRYITGLAVDQNANASPQKFRHDRTNHVRLVRIATDGLLLLLLRRDWLPDQPWSPLRPLPRTSRTRLNCCICQNCHCVRLFLLTHFPRFRSRKDNADQATDKKQIQKRWRHIKSLILVVCIQIDISVLMRNIQVNSHLNEEKNG